MGFTVSHSSGKNKNNALILTLFSDTSMNIDNLKVTFRDVRIL